MDDEANNRMTILFEFPDGYTCSAILNSDAPPVMDQKLKITMQSLAGLSTKVSTGKKTFEMEQTFQPGFFELRVITAVTSQLRRDKEEEEEEFSDFFQGMKIDEGMEEENEGEEP
jgi:soluble cytochrome b562